MAIDAASSAKATVRTLLREFVSEYLDDQDTVTTADIVAAARERFADDDEFLDAAAAALLELLVPEIVHDVARSRRTTWGAISEEREATAKQRLAAIFESHDGAYQSLLTMRRPEIQLVIDERRVRIAGELRYIGGLEACVKALPDDRTPLGRLAESKLAKIWTDHFEPGKR
jgi:hypothetical protein